MSKKYGKFRDTKGVISPGDDSAPEFGVQGAEIIEVEEESWFSIILGWVKGIIGFAVALVLVIASLVTILGMTLIVYSPITVTDDITDRTLVARGVWNKTGGTPPVGTIAVVSGNSMAPTGENWWDWVSITWVGIPNASKVKILTNSYEKLYISVKADRTDSEKVVYDATVQSIDNPDISGKFVQSPKLVFKNYEPKKLSDSYEFNYQLNDSYLVECVEGSCEPGTFFVVAEGQLFGEVR
jgi:hypothetical protein